MKLFTRTALCFVVLTGPALADTPTTPNRQPSAVRDIALTKDGVLHGVAMTTAAKPMANTKVVVRYGQHIVASTKTRKDGTFTILGVRGGMHTIQAGSRSHLCRFWTAKTAPPKAARVAAVNGDGNAVRGQYIPPVDLGTVVVAAGAGLIGGIIGYQIKDDGRRKTPSSP